MKYLQEFQSFIVESNLAIGEGHKKAVEEYYTKLLSKQCSNLELTGMFSSIAALDTTLYSRIEKIYDKCFELDKLDILKKHLKTLLWIEMRLDKMASNAFKGVTGAKDKVSTKGNVWAKDKFAKAKQIDPKGVDSNLNNFSNILQKMELEMPKKSDSQKPNSVETRYKELLIQWKENQKKLGKNTSPGQGTRARLMKQAQTETKNI